MRRVLSAVVVSTVVGAGLMFGGSGAVADDEPDAQPTLADALASAAAAGASGPDALSVAVGLPDSGPGSLDVDASGAVGATVLFEKRPDAAVLTAVRAVATVTEVHGFTPTAAVTVDPADLPALAAIPGVRSVTPVLAPTVGSVSASRTAPAAAPVTDCRAFVSDALEPLRADLAQERFDVDGSGITIGIISDSFDTSASATTTAAEDASLGVLPGPGNLCGYETPVTVLQDYEGGTDEGRGMAQLVHAIAPGATLLFHTGYPSSAGMADGIIKLADAGADIIVDDVSYLDEPVFQQGWISTAITEVQSRGVAYYTSAGNGNIIGASDSPSAGKPIGATQYEAYRPVACPAWVDAPEEFVTFDCMDFDPAGGGDPIDSFVFGGPATPTVAVTWAEPAFGVSSAIAPQLYTPGADGPELYASATLLNEFLPIAYAGADAPISGPDVDLVIIRDTATGSSALPAIWTGFWGNASLLQAREYDESEGALRVGLRSIGHAVDGSAIGVAAADWRTPTTPENFTSPGAGTLYFEPVAFGSDGPIVASAYPTPLDVPGPQITSVDGNRTSFFGQSVPDEEGSFFFGTSAAAPNAAAVHALAAGYAPALAAGEISQAMFDTARAVENPYAPYLSDEELGGAGLVDANALLEQLPPRAVASLVAEALSPTSVAVSWDAVAGATGYRVEVLAGDAVLHDVELDAEVTATTFDGLTAESSYTVRVTAIGASAYGPTASVDVSTPRPAVPTTTPVTPTVAELGSTPAPGLVATPATVAAGGTVTVTGLPPREYVYSWLFSDPTALGWAWTGADGVATVTVPASVPAGAHRLAFRAEDGTLLGWVALQVTAAAPVPAPAAALARTGQDTDLMPLALWAAGGLLVGTGLTVAVAASSRRRTASRS